MSLLAYPFFHDVAGTVGRLFNLQGECESTQVLRRMREAWGHRSTLERAVQRLLHTFLSWGVTRSVSSTGHLYQATSPRQTSNSAVALWFLECVLRSALEVRNTLGASSTSSRTAGEDAQLPFMDLIQSPAAFPFDLTAHAVTVRRSGRFAVQRQGLDLEMISLPSID
jgi:hypothetical protein